MCHVLFTSIVGSWFQARTALKTYTHKIPARKKKTKTKQKNKQTPLALCSDVFTLAVPASRGDSDLTCSWFHLFWLPSHQKLLDWFNILWSQGVAMAGALTGYNLIITEYGGQSHVPATRSTDSPKQE